MGSVRSTKWLVCRSNRCATVLNWREYCLYAEAAHTWSLRDVDCIWHLTLGNVPLSYPCHDACIMQLTHSGSSMSNHSWHKLQENEPRLILCLDLTCQRKESQLNKRCPNRDLGGARYLEQLGHQNACSYESSIRGNGNNFTLIQYNTYRCMLLYYMNSGSLVPVKQDL
jgi:hypothetical protein